MRMVFSVLCFALFAVKSLAGGSDYYTATDLTNGGKKCCYCEIGDYPSSQQGFFRVGCNMWLNSQKNCAVKEIVPQNTNYAGMDLACSGGEMAVGYVGHWSSTYETITYLNRTIVPAIKKHDVSVKVDNTACAAIDSPRQLLSFVNSLALPNNKILSFRGNQAYSVGKWDSVLGSAVNFSAEVSSNKSEVKYPSCKQFRRHHCVQQLQVGQTGKCMEDDKSISTLTCCGVTDNASDNMSTNVSYVWSDRNRCSVFN